MDCRRSDSGRADSVCLDGTQVEAAAWCDQAAADLEAAARGDLEHIAAEVERGDSVLWRITGKSVGWLVTRQEPGEFVIVAGAGVNALPVMAWARSQALAHGLSVRTHIQRPGLRRMYERLGFVADEIVMRARPDGQ